MRGAATRANQSIECVTHEGSVALSKEVTLRDNVIGFCSTCFLDRALSKFDEVIERYGDEEDVDEACEWTEKIINKTEGGPRTPRELPLDLGRI